MTPPTYRRFDSGRRHATAVRLGTAAFLVMGAIGATAAPSAANGSKNGSCFKSNTFNLASLPRVDILTPNPFVKGSFTASSDGSGSGAIAEDGGSATVHWTFSQKVKDPPKTATQMWGSLEVTIHETGKSPVEFEATCIAEAIVEDDGSGDQIIEAELQGRVVGGKFGDDGVKAVASILISGTVNAKGEGAVSSVNVGIEKGTTCNEPGGNANELSFKSSEVKPTKAEMELNPVPGVNTLSGAAALPNGITPDWNPTNCGPVGYL